MGIAADFTLIILAGLMGGLVARALGLPLLIGYIAAGVLVGPHTPGPTVGQVRDLELLAEIGVALLLFSLGLEVSVRDLIPVKRMALGGGPLQIALTGGLGWAAGVWLLGLKWTEAAWLGAMIALSSTMIVLKLVSASGHLATLASRVMIGLLVVQDLAVVPMLIVLPQLEQLGGAGGAVLMAVGKAGLFLAVIVGAGTRLLPRALAGIFKWGGRELFLVAVVAAGVGVGAAAHAVGLSFALGAFVAGLVLSESDLSYQALSDIVPLRDVFGLLFFVTVGMIFEPAYAMRHWVEVLEFTALIVVGKAALTGWIARGFGYRNMAPWIVGLGLAQIGEFSFVLARAGRTAAALSENTYNLALSCTIVTMLLSPALMKLALPLGRAWKRWRNPAPVEAGAGRVEPTELTGHVVIVGRGMSGEAVAKAAREARLDTVIVELDRERIQQQSDQVVIWGDATRPEILEAANGGEARVLVIALPGASMTTLVAETARRMNAGLKIIGRASAEGEIKGPDVVIEPRLEAAAAMAEEMLAGFGVEEAVERARERRMDTRGIAGVD